MGHWNYESDGCDEVMDYTRAGKLSLEMAIIEWDADSPFFPETSSRKASFLGIVLVYVKQGVPVPEPVLKRAFKYAQEIIRDRDYLKSYDNHIARTQQIQQEMILIRKYADQ